MYRNNEAPKKHPKALSFYCDRKEHRDTTATIPFDFIESVSCYGSRRRRLRGSSCRKKWRSSAKCVYLYTIIVRFDLYIKCREGSKTQPPLTRFNTTTSRTSQSPQSSIYVASRNHVRLTCNVARSPYSPPSPSRNFSKLFLEIVSCILAETLYSAKR